MFIVPPTDHTGLITLMGLTATGRPWQITVFSDETSHTYVGEAEQGETATVYAEHELSHVFYALLAKADNTHLYFFAGTPEKVLADFDFDEQELAWYQQVLQDLEEQIGLIKARQVPPIGDPAPTTPVKQGETPVSRTQTSNTSQSTFPPKINVWEAVIEQEEGARPELNNPGNLKYSGLTASWGATQGLAALDGGYLCKFLTLQAGRNALCNFLVLGCQDQLVAFHSPDARTLTGFTKIYAGNPPQGYIDAIVQAMGGDPNVQISTFLS
jgi:hypothetical protein